MGGSKRRRESASGTSSDSSSSSSSDSGTSSGPDSRGQSPPPTKHGGEAELRGSQGRADDAALAGPGPGQAPPEAAAADRARRSVFDRLGAGERDETANGHRAERGRDERDGNGDRHGSGRRRDDDRDRYRGGRDAGDDDRWRGDWEEQQPDRYRRRDGHRDRSRERDQARERDRGIERDRRDRDRDWKLERDHVREGERERDRYRDGGRDRERDRDRDLDRRRDGRDDDSSKRQRGDHGEREREGNPPETAAGPRPEGDEPGPAGDAGEAAAQPVARKPVALGKAGGVYIPPFKLARMMAEQAEQDKSSPEYQRLTWEALKKSLNGIINKINVVNVKNILPEVFRENLVRGRGLFCRSLMKSQAASPSFTPVYAALLAVVNTKFPEIGELLLSRLILQFKRSFKRNDKPVCTAAAKFIAHLVNQGVAHEVLALEVLILLLETPSEDSVEMAVEFVKEVGAHLQEVAPQGLHGVFERFRAILHEGQISKRVQFIIEGMFALRKAGFEASGFPALKPELDLVEAEDQITHEIGLDDELQAQMNLDVFRVDPEYEEGERKYAAIAKEILGEEEEDEEERGEGGAGGSEPAEEESSDEDDEGPGSGGGGGGSGGGGILDETSTNLVNLRRTIYLTLMSSFDFEEAGHKLLKVGIQPGQEIELVTMIIECCSQERTFKRFYGLLAQRFCYLSRAYAETFEDCFRKQYALIHRLETNKLRNVSCLFAHMLATDALPWSALTAVQLTEEDTTSSSRIFIKYLFQELSSTMGLVKLNQRLNDPAFSPWFVGIFPRDSLQHMRFSINFFTSIGLGGVTDTMREHYKSAVAAQTAAQQQQRAQKLVGSDSGSSSSDDSDSSSSDSESSSSSSSDSSDSDSDDSRSRRRKRERSKKAKKDKKGGRRDKGRK
ncbi:hypothetical protein GPECTOR_10g798 [Gonium pectorale]|uniref:MI domain-containing protein n=1 Tax=Gonium pectorale TaxID=33097 RepID=A0A150GQP8_GONPE|nr:hypothetical protein GPECTOR_10g798 [Gonium pectorale]|eukprot:KXZ52169.1 hypothetical protein GPECTOR_10g798 [Gonium pectorale]